jgi:hypothetical protein
MLNEDAHFLAKAYPGGAEFGCDHDIQLEALMSKDQPARPRQTSCFTARRTSTQPAAFLRLNPAIETVSHASFHGAVRQTAWTASLRIAASRGQP